ncbi:MLO-like protein 5, partial [Cucurbita argyrosperma subsp. argyrosperma]
MGEISSGSLETTPTWAVAVFTFVLFFLAFIIETSLHHLTKFLRRRKFKSFKRALEKIKIEMMKMGFISLLLAFTEASIPNICVTKRVSKSFLPCRDIAMEASMESVCFIRQFSGSVSKSDYFTLRNGFITVIQISAHAELVEQFEFGVKSCFNRRNEDITIRLGMGVGVQLLCGYVTLPLYALVTQMGSSLKRTVFTDGVVEGLKNWKKRSKRRLSNKRSSSTRHSKSMSFHSEHRNSLSHLSGREISIVATADEQNSTRGRSNSGGCDEEAVSCTQREKCKVGMRSNYDGEISFASTWKELENKMIGEGAYETL